MRRHDQITELLMIAGLVTAVALLPACRRAPEQEVAVEAPAAEVEPEPELLTIELPQTNPMIGITVDAAPQGIVATLNGDHWIELVDEAHPNVRYTFVANPDRLAWLSPSSVAEFEESILARGDGRITGGGTVETALGEASWSSGSYTEDGELLEEIFLVTPHPSGTGELTLLSACPPAAASVPQRLERIREIVAYVR